MAPNQAEKGYGRKEWSSYELMVAEAMETGPVKPPDLTGEVHKIFRREAWSCTMQEYNTLEPSMRLASNLLQLGMPYTSNFLPSDPIYINRTTKEPVKPNRISIKDLKDIFQPNIRAAAAELDDIADTLNWQVNYQMYGEPGYQKKPKRWVGITRLVPGNPPWEIVSAVEREAADKLARERGQRRRPLIIGIMGEYVEAISAVPHDTEEYIRAVFMAAITMTHEIGHAIYHQDFRSCDKDSLILKEPYSGIDCASELGNSFIHWIFSGFHPRFETTSETVIDFKHPLYWEPQYTFSNMLEGRPLYMTLYAIPIIYIEEKLTQQFWDHLGSPKRISFYAKARKALAPNVQPGKGWVATARVPNFEWSTLLNRVEWKDETFDMDGYRKGNKVIGVSDEEAKLERIREYQNSADMVGWEPATSDMSVKILERIRKRQTGTFNNDEEFESDSFGNKNFGDEDDDLAIDGHPKLLDINDGLLEQDVVLKCTKEKEIGIDSTREPVNLPLARIVVTYLRGNVTAPKNARAPEDDERGQRKRLKRGHIQAKHDGSIPEYVSLDRCIESICPNTISNMTRITAHNFCIGRGLRTYVNLQPLVSWQQSQLDMNDAEDMGMASKISEFLTLCALKHPKFQYMTAQVKLREAALENVDSWCHADLLEFCQNKDLEADTNLNTLVKQVKSWKRDDIFAARMKEWDETLDSGVADIELDLANAPSHMGVSDLREFCKLRSLPEWGNRRALVHRAQNCLKNEEAIKSGSHPLIRAAQPFRTDRQGFEMYVYHAVLEHSTVTALKSALLIDGNFDAACILRLFFYPDETHILEDDKPLNEYRFRDWTTLRLKVRTKWMFGPGSVSSKPIDLTVPGMPKFNWKGIKPSPATPAPSIDPALLQLARQQAVKKGFVEPTLEELLQSVLSRAPFLNNLIDIGTLGPKGGPRERSGLEIFDEIQDIEENDEPLPDEPEPRQNAGGANGLLNRRSNMQEIFQTIQNPRKFEKQRPGNADTERKRRWGHI